MYPAPYPAYYPPPEDAGYFYDSLAPYGSWLNVAGLGLCWQPTAYVRDHDWRPYGDRGRWLYSDSGWYWQSDYSWGWAPFHYGRWLQDEHRGWVWRPDRTWGSAWVSWRHADGYAGWAPLPPGAEFVSGAGFRYHNQAVGAGFDFGLEARSYTFVPVERLSDSNPIRYGVTQTTRVGLFYQSTVANNFTIENHRIVSHGIDPALVTEAGGTAVRRAVIHDAPANSQDRRIRAESLEQQGNSLVIVRPQLPALAASSTSALSATSGAAQASSRLRVNYANHNEPYLSATPAANPGSSTSRSIASVAGSNPALTPSAASAPAANRTFSYTLVPKNERALTAGTEDHRASGRVTASQSWPTRSGTAQPLLATSINRETYQTGEAPPNFSWRGSYVVSVAKTESSYAPLASRADGFYSTSAPLTPSSRPTWTPRAGQSYTAATSGSQPSYVPASRSNAGYSASGSSSSPAYTASARTGSSYAAPSRVDRSYSAPPRPEPSYVPASRSAPSHSAPASASYSAPTQSYHSSGGESRASSSGSSSSAHSSSSASASGSSHNR